MRAVLQHRLLVVLGVLAATIAFGLIAARLPLMSAARDYIPEDTPGIEIWEAARDRFGGDETVMIVLEADDHFTGEGLARIEAATKTIADHPLVERVISLSTAQQIRADPDDPGALRIERHVRSGVDPAQVEAAVRADPLLRGSMVSDDGRFVVLVAQLVAGRDDVAQRPDVRAEVERRTRHLPGVRARLATVAGARSMLEVSKQLMTVELVDWVEAAGFGRAQIHAVGFPLMMASMVADARRNLLVLFPISVLLIAFALALLLRRPVDVLIPLVCVVPAVIWAVALGGLVFGRVTVFSAVAPTMVLVVGVSDVVHLVTQFRHLLAKGLQRDDAIRLAFRQVGAACALTSLTTMIGFGSMALAPIRAVQELGLFAAFGVVTAFVLSFVLTPIMLSSARSVSADEAARFESGRLADLLRRTSRFVAPRPGAIIAAGFILTVATVTYVAGLEVENDFTRKLALDHPVRRAVQVVDAQFGGSTEIELLVDTGKADGLTDPAVIAGLRALQVRLAEDPRIANTRSIVDVLARMHAVLAPDASSPVPSTQQQIAQYLLLFDMAGGRDLETLIDDTGRHARAIVRAVDLSAEGVGELAADIDALAIQALPSSATARASGISVLVGRLGPRILSASLTSFAVALALIAVLIGLIFGSIRVGVLSLVPNLLPVALGVTVVAASYELVDADTLTFLAICIGIAVDDTIHFLARYRIERRGGLDRDAAVEATIHEAGHGMIRTSVILVVGFLALVASDYQPVSAMGIQLPLTLAAAVLLDITLVPAMALLGWLEPRR